MSTDHALRRQAVDEHTRGEISAYHGIVSAYLADLADLLNASPTGVLEAMEQADVEPMMDTATPGNGQESHDRPTDPELRCIALTEQDLRRVAAVVGAAEALEDGSASTREEKSVAASKYSEGGLVG